MVDEIPLEASPEDVFEQRIEMTTGAPEDDFTVPGGPATTPVSVPWDADPADVVEQHSEVPLDDEEWS